MKDREILVEIGRVIKALRTAKGLSQEQLSEICKVDRSFLGKVERGEVNVSVLHLCDIAKGLEVSVKQFFIENE